MAQACSIWAPLIIAELTDTRKINRKIAYTVDKSFYSVEDIKLKVKRTEIKEQGKNVETNVKIDIIYLLTDIMGHMHLINREEILKERISLIEFNNILDNEKQIEFQLNIINLKWEGELSGYSIKTDIFLEYMVFATKEQVVRFLSGEEIEKENKIISSLEEEIIDMEKDNQVLRKKIFLYEKNISSLKKGINKAENRNAVLNKEVEKYQKILEKLQTATKVKNASVNIEKKDFEKFDDKNINIQNTGDNFTNNLGSRIKRMFSNSF